MIRGITNGTICTDTTIGKPYHDLSIKTIMVLSPRNSLIYMV